MPGKRPVVAGFYFTKKNKIKKYDSFCDEKKNTHLAETDTFHDRFFKIAGITIRVVADLPIKDSTFAAKFKQFQICRQTSEQVRIMHHFMLPRILPSRLGRKIYSKAPWVIYSSGSSWSYLGVKPDRIIPTVYCFARFNESHTRARIYHSDGHIFNAGNLHSLSLFPTDQIWLAPLLAARQGFILHAAGMKIDNQGFLFAGHSEAGKSTTVTLLQDEGEILCDDRIIVRRWPRGFNIYGTWSHGDVPHVSAAAAPLRAILFLEKTKINRLVAIDDPQEKLNRLLPLLIKPLVTADWWEKTLAVVEKLVREVPAYRMQFDKSGRIKEIIRKLAAEPQGRKRSRARIRLP